MTTDGDLAVVRRAGRKAALQASLALAGVLLVVGAVIFIVDVRVQSRQIAAVLTSVALTADDAGDPPPGMILVLRDLTGRVDASVDGLPLTDLLSRPDGFFDVRIGGGTYRGLVDDRPEGRVVVLLALDSYDASRNRMLVSLGLAELAGILASVAVVVMLTRRSIRPLAEALAMQRRFVADASHELRAPLTVLHTRIQLLGRRFEDGAPHEAKEQIDALAADTRALGEVVDDLLASASMATDGVASERVDVYAVAEAVRNSMAEHAASAGVSLVVERDRSRAEADFAVIGSGTALRRAITSLVDNALAHEHAGGSISIAVTRRDADVAIAVRDDGVGVDPDAVATLFNRFSHGQAHTSTAGRERYGIGLALVRETALAHRGDISVAQTPGGGATFTLTLPAAPRV
jgi:signal transduction histidine kinase